MNRILEFKIWDIKEEKWVSALKYAQLISQVNYSDTLESMCIDNGVQPRYSVRQWTGFVDRNDKRIFEGDRVNLHDMGENFIFEGVVEWIQKEGGWMVVRRSGDGFRDCSLCSFIAESCEVIDG